MSILDSSHDTGMRSGAISDVRTTLPKIAQLLLCRRPMYEQDTIAAIATPPGEGAVAIVRISGLDAETIAGRIFLRPGNRQDRLASHKLYHGKLRDPRTEHAVDEVLLTIMRGPKSYTGEDVVEVYCHGGTYLTQRVLRVILGEGARQAERGEFTKRAFLNGKLDLAQAEAVLDLIQAKTEKSAEIALNQSRGSLSNHIGTLREELLDILVQVEAAIDFPDEDIELLQTPKLVQKISRLANKISEISNTYDWGKFFREGARVCLCGRPNVGKSSLLNALLGENRVIVTAIPGTTRDVIEEMINLNGLPVVLWDTAGIRETKDEVERLGVESSRRHLEKADAAILVLDGSEPLTGDDRTLIELLKNKKKLFAINKSDLPNAISQADVGEGNGATEFLSVSARTGDGIGKFKLRIRNLLVGQELAPGIVVSNIRHQSNLIRARDRLNSAGTALHSGIAPELAAVDLNEARDALEEIIGPVGKSDILERIFNDFCIGK